ncbi:MAG: hypothetical protein A3D67_03550 [Candidatus Lloydbacteria bacterium RIFCSPHIGHO2_02_FULL_51_22]|uniref:DUF5667 domain-containing protein n=2 Tax=Candidatus Lloydiibacteriota TaxID=1817910 RepID=A0A1G2DA11_9BACT|nr:MAG: hypothetical protein A3D67_03550 [Candidatus Lloydbacteria bacterium RIFCSPHIGHO2_02_FULL_51_22]OGZ14081.1 MAG: hypothetical protein A3J08_01930 [Candidatus Lloydbacteria bacterium RIFCSPLOWO2_02_FULL_51_11]
MISLSAHKYSLPCALAIATLCTVFFLVGVVSAQEAVPSVEEDAAAIAPAGVTPGNPLYAADRFFERMGLFFAFGKKARAERLTVIAEERLSEAREIADTDEEGAQILVGEYETAFENASVEAELSGDEDAQTRFAEQAARHSSVLDTVIERVPEKARENIRAARDRFVENHIALMRVIAEKNPERAAELFSDIAERRAVAAERQAERKEDTTERRIEREQEVAERLKEYDKYAAFGEEVSLIARKIKAGEATDEVLERATERHREVLERVRENVPEAAREGLENALLRAREMREIRTEVLSPVEIDEKIIERQKNALERRELIKDVVRNREREPLMPFSRPETEEVIEGEEDFENGSPPLNVEEGEDGSALRFPAKKQPSPVPTNVCQKDLIEAAKASAGKQCTMIVKIMTCPRTPFLTTTATNGCIISELTARGWGGPRRTAPVNVY